MVLTVNDIVKMLRCMRTHIKRVSHAMHTICAIACARSVTVRCSIQGTWLLIQIDDLVHRAISSALELS